MVHILQVLAKRSRGGYIRKQCFKGGLNIKTFIFIDIFIILGLIFLLMGAFYC